MRSGSLLVALLSLAPAASGEVLVSAGSGTWSGAGGGSVVWLGGTPSPDDDFTSASGHVVSVAGEVALTTGSVTVAAGGRLAVGPGQVLRPGSRLVVRTGATYEQLGAALASCAIEREPDWSGADPSVT